MSFDDATDIESQLSDASEIIAPPAEFTRLTESVHRNIFFIASNVALIHKYISRLGTSRDTEKLRLSLMDVFSRVKDVSRDTLPDIKALSLWDPRELGPGHKRERNKLSIAFQGAITDIQNAQKLAVEKEKDYLREQRDAIAQGQETTQMSEEFHKGIVKHAHPLSQSSSPLSDNESLDSQLREQVIEDRERDVGIIEKGISELNDIFRELGAIVVRQGTWSSLISLVHQADILDHLEWHIDLNMQSPESSTAALLRTAGRRVFWSILVLLLIGLFVLLAIVGEAPRLV
jgi:Syntaxin-like protein